MIAWVTLGGVPERVNEDSPWIMARREEQNRFAFDLMKALHVPARRAQPANDMR